LPPLRVNLSRHAKFHPSDAPDHWLAREIYDQGIASGNVTCETELPDWEKWDDGQREDCRLAAVVTSNQH